ncbi:MAG: hypothetical protein AB2L14_33465 [Candidatus Xenobiia bacterium LiM19]
MFSTRRFCAMVFITLLCAVFFNVRHCFASEESLIKPGTSSFNKSICTTAFSSKAVEADNSIAASAAGQQSDPVTPFILRDPLKERAQLSRRQYGSSNSEANQETAAFMHHDQFPAGFAGYSGAFCYTSALTTPVHTASGRSPPLS